MSSIRHDLQADGLSAITQYHLKSKHSMKHGYAPGPGGLSWATQPDPFRNFAGSSRIPLPAPKGLAGCSYEQMFTTPQPALPLTQLSISSFFFNSASLSAEKRAYGDHWFLRTNPSSGNLHPTEFYLLLPDVRVVASPNPAPPPASSSSAFFPSTSTTTTGGFSPTDYGQPGLTARPFFPQQAGVFHYAPRQHALEQRAMFPSTFLQALARTAAFPTNAKQPMSEAVANGDGFFVGLSSILWRESWKYGYRAYRYCQLDAGHALACLRFAAAINGWQVRVCDRFSDTHIAQILGLNREGDFHDMEREEPELMCFVSPLPTSRGAPPAFPSGGVPGLEASLGAQLSALCQGIADSAAWSGKAEPLSVSHVDWGLSAVAAACRSEAGNTQTQTSPPSFSLSSKSFSFASSTSSSSSFLGQKTPDSFTALPQTPTLAPLSLNPSLSNTENVNTNTKAYTPIMAASTPGPPPGTAAGPNSSMSAAQLIRRRRSAQAMDGCTYITAAQFFAIMHRCTPSAHSVPFDMLPYPCSVHLLLFVHRVRGLAPGLYMLVRNTDSERSLRQTVCRTTEIMMQGGGEEIGRHTQQTHTRQKQQQTHTQQQQADISFQWRRPPGCPASLPLYLLLPGDVSQLSGVVSCLQDIASDGCFSVAMLSEFDRALGDRGVHAYRQLHWECGLIGQVLYLEAEAHAVRGTGIGCFFDDAVHELLGLTNDQAEKDRERDQGKEPCVPGRPVCGLQDLYHFTVGGPLVDKRIDSVEPYHT